MQALVSYVCERKFFSCVWEYFTGRPMWESISVVHVKGFTSFCESFSVVYVSVSFFSCLCECFSCVCQCFSLRVWGFQWKRRAFQLKRKVVEKKSVQFRQIIDRHAIDTGAKLMSAQQQPTGIAYQKQLHYSTIYWPLRRPSEPCRMPQQSGSNRMLWCHVWTQTVS